MSYRGIRHCTFIFLLSFLGCSNSPSPTNNRSATLAHDFEILSETTNVPLSRWRLLAKSAINEKNWSIAAASYKILCQQELTASLKSKACQQLLVTSYLISEQAQLFDIYITLYLNDNQTSMLQSANRIASNDVQRARVSLAKGKLPIMPLSDLKQLPASDIGQYHYLVGKANKDLTSLLKAVEWFSLSRQKQKEADAYFLIAQLQDNKVEAARAAAKSYFLLEQVNNNKAKDVVGRWLDEHSPP